MYMFICKKLFGRNWYQPVKSVPVVVGTAKNFMSLTVVDLKVHDISLEYIQQIYIYIYKHMLIRPEIVWQKLVSAS